ncbi:transmembrane 4 L6 family member 18 isoform X2 [Rhincodon typus]|uniref:transmembrane 4 L6 family member 18 isoform X2 n=1 Tax=Rhincodon typus TaxID=259920 RepID=UPI00202F40F1|nr:transmembrane 4 L6 family member 18 isoform X2 [Rhincodon typus]
MYCGNYARCIGITLIPLAVSCFVADILLYFPNGETKYAERDQLTFVVWFFEGIGGGGILMIFPIVVFIGLGNENIYGHCRSKICGKNRAMVTTVMVSLIGMAGGGYCFNVSLLGLLKGPYCLTELGWNYPFNNTNGRYLTNLTIWNECSEPSHIVAWNVTLFSILLAFSGVEIVLIIVHVIIGLAEGAFGNCCRSHENKSKECIEIDVNVETVYQH